MEERERVEQRELSGIGTDKIILIKFLIPKHRHRQRRQGQVAEQRPRGWRHGVPARHPLGKTLSTHV